MKCHFMLHYLPSSIAHSQRCAGVHIEEFIYFLLITVWITCAGVHTSLARVAVQKPKIRATFMVCIFNLILFQVLFIISKLAYNSRAPKWYQICSLPTLLLWERWCY